MGWGQRNFHGGNGNGPPKGAGEQTDYGGTQRAQLPVYPPSRRLLGASRPEARTPPAAPPFTSAGWAAAVDKTNAPPPALYLSTHQPARQPTILACCCF